MADFTAPLDAAIEAVDRLRRILHKGTNRQVRNAEERTLVKATALTWFRNHYPPLKPLASDPLFQDANKMFTALLEAAEQNVSRDKYRDDLQILKTKLVNLRSTGILASPDSHQRPQFDGLISDERMLTILNRRWDETLKCNGAGAHLAATVMLGGLLEALFLARINRMPKLAPVFTATAAPRDREGKTRSLKEWGLKDYLDVGNELTWIRQSAKDVGEVLRDYRNYIHPEKELSHNISVNGDDTRMFLVVFTSIAEQIIKSAKS